MIENIKIEAIENFEDLILSMQLNTRYNLPDNCSYKWIKIEKDNEYFSEEIYYSWAMEYNYNVSGNVGYIYPIKGNNKVQHFKTELGAKRNFIKSYKHYFDNAPTNKTK